MLYISVIVNLDTRPENSHNKEMFNGVVDREFLVDGLINKRKFFAGYEFELIAYVDEHEPIDEVTLGRMREVCDVLIIRKHNRKFEDIENYPAFNDLNYMQALFNARGKFIFHFDGDTAAFCNSPAEIKKYIDLLESYDIVSYPSYWSPHPTQDDSWQNKFWASTRFFCCKRSTLDFSELMKCQLDYDYWRQTYPMPKLCHWLEHLIASIAHNKGNGVFYPPLDAYNHVIFTWGSYSKGTLAKLNELPYDEIEKWVREHPLHYPNDVNC